MARFRARSAHFELRADRRDWASVLVEDVYNGLDACRDTDRIVQIAVVQEIEKSKFADVSRRAFGFQFPVVSCGATYAPKKVWGFARVEADGSAHFKVPAQVPIYFIALDEFGRGIQRMRSFTHLMPGEQQSCVGCHSDRNYVTPNTSARPLAALRPAEELEVPEWGLRGFSYPHIVQPVLDRYCVECHNATRKDGMSICAATAPISSTCRMKPSRGRVSRVKTRTRVGFPRLTAWKPISWRSDPSIGVHRPASSPTSSCRGTLTSRAATSPHGHARRTAGLHVDRPERSLLWHVRIEQQRSGRLPADASRKTWNRC